MTLYQRDNQFHGGCTPLPTELAQCLGAERFGNLGRAD
jgi:hypothetical protein